MRALKLVLYIHTMEDDHMLYLVHPSIDRGFDLRFDPVGGDLNYACMNYNTIKNKINIVCQISTVGPIPMVGI